MQMLPSTVIFARRSAHRNLIELCKSQHIHIINDQPVETAVNVVDEETVDAEKTANVPDDFLGDSRIEEAETNDDELDDDQAYHDEDEVIVGTCVEKKNRWMLQN